MSFFTFTFYLHHFHSHLFSENLLHLLHRVLHFSLYTPRISSLFTTTFIQKWPVRMNPTQLPRKPLHPRNTSRNLGNQVTSTLVNLGIMKNIAMNIMNTVKFLGNHWDRMRIFRVSLEPLVEWQNSWWFMSKRGKPREKGRRRRFNLLKSLRPRGRGLKKMTLQCTEMGHWRVWPQSLRHPFPSSTMACSSI